MKSASIVWALDPFDENRTGDRLTNQVIQLWKGSSAERVFPVSVLASYQLGWDRDLAPLMPESAILFADKIIRPIVRAAGLKKAAPPEVLVENMLSKRLMAKALIKSAQDHEAEIIVASTHGRRGLKRARLGSFVETLMVLSRIPVLSLNAKAKVPTKIKTIFFPCDFSAGSKKALRKVVGWARRFDARIVLYHVVEVPPRIVGFGMPEPTMEWLAREAEENDSRTSGNTLAKGVRKQGVECDFILETKPVEMGEAINLRSNAVKADLIVLTASRGPWNQALFGRSMRDVLTSSKRPVIVVHA